MAITPKTQVCVILRAAPGRPKNLCFFLPLAMLSGHVFGKKLLRLHPHQSLANPLRWNDQQLAAPAVGAPFRRRQRLHFALSYRPVGLVRGTRRRPCREFTQQAQQRRLAGDPVARAMQVKGWTRAKKMALIVVQNPDWRDLSEEWGKPAVMQFRGEPVNRIDSSAGQSTPSE